MRVLFDMTSEKHLKILKKVANILTGNKINWMLIGSANLSLQGVEIEADDLDILTDKKGIEEIDSLLSEFRTQKPVYSSTTVFKSLRGLYEIDDIQIDVVSNLQHNENKSWNKERNINKKEFIDLDEVKIPIMPINEEYKAYVKMGRLEKAKRIKEFLDKN